MQVLETCEIKATHNIEEIQSNLGQLKEKLATSSVNHEKGKILWIAAFICSLVCEQISINGSSVID